MRKGTPSATATHTAPFETFPFWLGDSVCLSNIFRGSSVLEAAHSAIKATSEGAVRLGSGILVVHAIASSFLPPPPPKSHASPARRWHGNRVPSMGSATTSAPRCLAAWFAGVLHCTRSGQPAQDEVNQLYWHPDDTGINDIHFLWGSRWLLTPKALKALHCFLWWAVLGSSCFLFLRQSNHNWNQTQDQIRKSYKLIKPISS